MRTRYDLDNESGMTAGEARVRAALRWHGRDIDPLRVDEVARRWGGEIGAGSPSEVLRRVTARLERPHSAAQVTATGGPITLDPKARQALTGRAAEYDRDYHAEYGGGGAPRSVEAENRAATFGKIAGV